MESQGSGEVDDEVQSPWTSDQIKARLTQVNLSFSRLAEGTIDCGNLTKLVKPLPTMSGREIRRIEDGKRCMDGWALTADCQHFDFLDKHSERLNVPLQYFGVCIFDNPEVKNIKTKSGNRHVPFPKDFRHVDIRDFDDNPDSEDRKELDDCTTIVIVLSTWISKYGDYICYPYDADKGIPLLNHKDPTFLNNRIPTSDGSFRIFAVHHYMCRGQFAIDRKHICRNITLQREGHVYSGKENAGDGKRRRRQRLGLSGSPVAKKKPKPLQNSGRNVLTQNNHPFVKITPYVPPSRSVNDNRPQSEVPVIHNETNHLAHNMAMANRMMEAFPPASGVGSYVSTGQHQQPQYHQMMSAAAEDLSLQGYGAYLTQNQFGHTSNNPQINQNYNVGMPNESNFMNLGEESALMTSTPHHQNQVSTTNVNYQQQQITPSGRTGADPVSTLFSTPPEGVQNPPVRASRPLIPPEDNVGHTVDSTATANNPEATSRDDTSTMGQGNFLGNEVDGSSDEESLSGGEGQLEEVNELDEVEGRMNERQLLLHILKRFKSVGKVVQTLQEEVLILKRVSTFTSNNVVAFREVYDKDHPFLDPAEEPFMLNKVHLPIRTRQQLVTCGRLFKDPKIAKQFQSYYELELVKWLNPTKNDAGNEMVNAFCTLIFHPILCIQLQCGHGNTPGYQHLHENFTLDNLEKQPEYRISLANLPEFFNFLKKSCEKAMRDRGISNTCIKNIGKTIGTFFTNRRHELRNTYGLPTGCSAANGLIPEQEFEKNLIQLWQNPESKLRKKAKTDMKQHWAVKDGDTDIGNWMTFETADVSGNQTENVSGGES